MADEIIVRIRAEGQEKFVRDLKKAGIAVEKTGDQVEKSTKKSESSFKSLGKTIGAALATGAIIEFGRVMVKTATDIDATNKKIQTVFGKSTKAVEDFAKTSANSLGLTENQFKRAAAAAGDLLVPIGFQRKEAAALSVQLVKLSGALAAWTGGQFNASEVSQILTKALLGEREQLKQLGIQITETDVKNRLAEKGLKNLTGATLAQEKATATLELITEKSADAQAAFADNTTTLAEAQQELNATILQIRDNLAEGLIPFLARTLDLVNDSIEGWQTLFRVLGIGVNAQKELTDATFDELSQRRNLLRSQLEEAKARNANVIEIRNIKKTLSDVTEEYKNRISAGRQYVVQVEEEADTTVDAVKKIEEATGALFVFIDALNESFTTDPVNALAGDIEKNLIPVLFNAASLLNLDFAFPDIDEEGAVRKNTEARIAFAEMEKDEKVAFAIEAQDLTNQALNEGTQIAGQAFQARQVILENQLREGRISEEEYQREVAELRRKQAVADKAQAVFQATLNIANAVTKSFAQGGGLLGPGFSAIAITAGVAQLAAILATPIPQFAVGTKGRKKAPKGMAWVGEEGPELVQMRGGENVFTADDSEQLMKLLGSYGVAVQFKTPYDELYKPMTAMRNLSKDTPAEGINWNPLLNSNDINRRSSGRKLDKIHMELQKMNRGITRKMTKA